MSVGIREIDITYGLNLAAAGFRKICAEDGTPRPLYCSSEESSDSSNPSNCSYLWVNYNGNADTGFITDLYIIYGEELSPPEGCQVLKKNICRGSSFKAYLCFKRLPSSSHTVPITFVKIFEQNKPLEPGFEMVASPPSLSPPIRLAISRTRSSSSLYLSSSNPLSSGNLRELERPKLSSGVEMKDLSLTRLQKMEEKLPDENAWLETIPNFVEQLLSSSISDSSLLIPINDFFKAVLESISAYFQSENTAFHDQRFYCLRILLSMKPGDTWYYENYGKATSDDKLSKNYYVEGEVAKIPKTSFLDTSAPAGVSRLLIMNLNNFGASQGFHKFLSRIHKSDASPRYLASLSQVQEFLLLMRGWTRVARNRFKRSFFPSLQATTLLRLSHLTSLDLEELQTGCLRDKGRDIGSVDRVLKELDATLRAGNFGGYLWEGVEDRIQLDVVRQFLFSQFLALRIRAMSLLQDIIERVSAPRATSTHGNIFSLSVSRHASPAPGLEMSTWLTADYFLDWLVTSEVLLVMLGEEEALKKYGVADNHMEILRRSEPVLLFLIDRHKLSPPILSLVCNMCNRKFNSEGRVKVGYRLLTSLIGKLDQSQLRQVFETVAGVTNEPEEAHIELLKTMARTALELNCSEEDFGLQALWRISQGGASPQPVRKMAAFALAELLASKAAETPLRFILLNIVTVLNGDDHAQSRHACALMRSILSAQSLSSTQPSGAAATKKDACRDSTILLAESSFHFLAVLLDELKRAVVANVGQEELIPRLNFVRYILENSVLQLTYDRLESLWSVFNDSKAPHLTELFLKWLTELVPWEQHIYRMNICISADTADAFFESHIRCEPSSLRYSSLGIEGYECVELMFRFINGREKTMSFAMAKDYFVVEEDRLIGLSVLFRAIREPTSDLVSQRATQFIVSLQTHLNPRLDKYMYWTSFVTKCMTMVLRYVDLYDTHGEYPVERIDNVIYRLLNILVQLISAIRRPMTSPSAEPVSPNDVKVSVYLKCPNSSASSSKSGFVYIFKRKGLTIGSIRSRLSCDLNHDTKLVQMRLTHQNKALSLADDHSTSLEHVMSPVFLEATLLTESNELEEEDVCDSYNAARPGRTSDDDPDSDQMRLRIFLSSHPAYFSCFFRLLSSSNSKITGLVWKLLESLPVNVHMKDAFMCFHARSDSASAVNWSEVLSISQPMHLLYRLRVILQLLSCVNDPFAVVEERESARNWYHYFVRAEGMKHIANLFVSTNVVSLTEPFVLQHELLFLMLNILTEALMLSEPIRDREKGVVEGTILIEGSTDAGGVNSDFDSYMDAVIATPMADGGNDLVDEIFDDAEDVYFHSIDVTVAATTAIRTTPLSSSGDRFECGSPKDPSMYTTSEDRSASDRNWDSRVSWIMVAEKMVSLIHAVSVLASEQEKGFQKGTVSISLGLDSLSPPPPFALQDIRDESSCGRGIMRIMETGVALLVAITTRDPLLFSSLLSLPTLQPALIFSLLQSPVMSRMVSRGIWKLCTTADVSPAPFVRLLLPAFAQTADFEHSCNEFFKLIIDLVALPGALEDIEVSDILLKLNRAIVERPNVELSEEDDDFPLQGYMSLILGILAALPSIDRSQVIALTLEHVDLVHELLTNCLFPISASPQNQSIFSEHEFFIPKPKCLSPTSRTLAFSLLTELANSSHTVYNRTLNFVSQLYSLRDFDTTGLRRLRSSSDHGTRTKTGYCGLQNPGCICYLNSSLQQFFMVPSFRRGILSIPPEELYNPNIDPADNILIQLQHLFAAMEASETAVVNPSAFCHALKDFDGNPTDIMLQQDATEFLIKFFQQVEERLTGTSMERLLQDTFGGLMTNVLSTRDGSQYSERLEPFFNIAMDVGNGKSGLVESLDDYFKEEPVEYSWETKGLDGTVEMKPLPTMKKVAIQKLPQQLIFNLRRFDFNFETFMLTKKNDRFEFPLLLNMAPYILRRKASTGIISGEDERDHEGGGDEEDSSILYELSGIVVHMGTADSGHYYSFSKERLPHQKGSSSVPIPDDTSSRWYEFNDSLVREFSIKDLEEEAFGGPLSFPSTTSSLPGIEKMKIKNAYFLLYDRKITEADSHLSTSLHDYKGNNVSLSLRREVHAANLRFWREKSIFSASFIHFMTNLLNLPPIIDDKNDRHSFESLQASVFFFFVILLQAGEKELIIAWSHIISRILRSSAQLSEWLLRKLLATENRVLLEKLMTSSSFTHTCVLRVLANAVESATNDSELKASLASLSQLLVQFILAFVSSKAFSRNTLFTTLAPLPHLFHPIAVHAKIFPDLCSSLIKEGALLKLLSIFAFDSFGQPTNLQSMSNTMPSFEEGLIAGSIQTGLIGSIVGLIEFLSRNISKVEEQVVSVLSTLNLPYGVIQQLRAIYGVQFKGNLRKALSALHSLVTFAISNSKSRTQTFLDTAVAYIGRMDGVDVKEGFRLCKLMLRVDDNLTEWRVHKVMDQLVATLELNSKNIFATEVSADMLLRLSAVEQVRRWFALESSANKLKWLENWLEKKCAGTMPEEGLMSKASASIKTPKHPSLASNRRLEAVSVNSCSSSPAMLARLRRLQRDIDHKDNELGVSFYDSDDEPASLVGRRIEVKWAQNRYFTGTVGAYVEALDEMEAEPARQKIPTDPEENVPTLNPGQHRVDYDDGDVKSTYLQLRHWKFASS